MNRDYFSTLARYNGWMNERLYRGCAQLHEDDLMRDRGAFFGSIFATLNHLVYGDMAWLGRFTGNESPHRDPGGPVHTDFAALHASRAELDRKIEAWTNNLEEAWLRRDFTFTSNIDGMTRTRPTWLLVAHMFKHQTHHRGQVTTLLSQQGVDIGSTDLPWMDDD